jgi:hypothetical protein
MPILWEEPFGIVMAEAMACGTPVIGLRRGSVPEVVVDGETGFVVDTVEEMAAAVGRIPAISRAACRARVERLYSDAAITEGYLGLYAELIARVRGARSGRCTAPLRPEGGRQETRLAHRLCLSGNMAHAQNAALALAEAGRSRRSTTFAYRPDGLLGSFVRRMPSKPLRLAGSCAPRHRRGAAPPCAATLCGRGSAPLRRRPVPVRCSSTGCGTA